MWWLCAADLALPIGDILFNLGIIVICYETCNTLTYDEISISSSDSTNEKNSSSSQSHAQHSSPNSPKPPDNKNNKPSLKKVTKYLLKKLGIDAHKVKQEYLGKQAEIKLYDLAYDTATGKIYIITKAGEIVAETYYYISGGMLP